MLAIQCQVTIPHRNGLPKDTVTNTWTIRTRDTWLGTNADLGEVTIPLAQWYITEHAVGAGAVGAFIGTQMSRLASACRIKCYDITNNLDGSPHGSPFNEDGFTLPAGDQSTGNFSLPSEVATVVRLRTADFASIPAETPDDGAVGAGGLADADLLPDRPRQRHTGRIYLGPLTLSALSKNATDDLVLDATMRGRLTGATEKLQNDLQVGGHSLGIWSRKDQSVYAAGWVQVDDAPDTQRRRGIAPSVTTTLAL